MFKANKHNIQHLKDISSELNHGLKLLMSSEYQIMRPTNSDNATIFTAPYYPGQSYYMMTKEIGNALVPMWSAIKSLEKLLSEDQTND